jgi:hypothetical protein
MDPLSTIASLKSCTFTSIFEGEDHRRGFHFIEVVFRSDTSNPHDGHSNISQGATAEIVVSIAQPNGAPAGPAHVRSMASALADVKEGIVVKAKAWHEKHGVWYRYGDDDSGDEPDSESQTSSDADMSDDSEEE